MDAPITRIEYYLAKLSGMDVTLPEPITRLEQFYAKWAGLDIETPEPETRLERLLHDLASVPPTPPEPELPDAYRRVIGFDFSSKTYYQIQNFKLHGSDTIRLAFSVRKSCNVFGCYTNTSANDNFSLYASTSIGAKYLRYDGDTYNSYVPSARLDERLDVVISPTGTTGMPVDSEITPVEFTTSVDLCIGTTGASATSAKLDGCIWGNYVVDGRLKLIPCERKSDSVLGYYDTYTKTFYEPIGSAPTSLGYDE